MKVEELKPALAVSAVQVADQQAYVNKLTDMYNSGKQTLEVFDKESNQWTTVNLPEFFTIQNNKLIALMQDNGKLNTIYGKLQALLDAEIVKPAAGYQ